MKRMSRRDFVVASAITALAPCVAQGNTPRKILFVHGRAQGNREQEDIRAEWIAALQEGADALGGPMPEETAITLPFYGARLDHLVELSRVSTAGRITQKGDEVQDGYLQFQAEIANEMRQDLGISDAEIDHFYGDDPTEKGPLNWRWVHAIVRAIDARSDTLTASGLELVTRDVFLYLELDRIRDEVNAIVESAMSDEPTIVVGHSLGTVVAYDILRNRQYDVPLFMTLGSPLGINAIRRRLAPIKYPIGVGTWKNYFDDRDIVALRPLDPANFPVEPEIENFPEISNRTDNRHGISGYLNTSEVAAALLREIV